MVLPSPTGGDVPPSPSMAVVLGSSGVSGWDVLLVALGTGLAVVSAGLESDVADGAERLPLEARRGKSSRDPVLSASVPWVGGCGDGLAVMIVRLGAGSTALVPRT